MFKLQKGTRQEDTFSPKLLNKDEEYFNNLNFADNIVQLTVSPAELPNAEKMSLKR